jgi:hypothetical protein
MKSFAHSSIPGLYLSKKESKKHRIHISHCNYTFNPLAPEVPHRCAEDQNLNSSCITADIFI